MFDAATLTPPGPKPINSSVINRIDTLPCEGHQPDFELRECSHLANVSMKYAVALFLGLSLAAPAHANTDLLEDIENRDYPLSFSGSYLAALTAGRTKDLEAAALFYDKALGSDPENVALIERTFMLRLADGDIEGAIELTEPIIKLDEGNRFARLALGVYAFKSKSYKTAVREFEQIEKGPLAKLSGNLLHAWTLVGSGDVEQALAIVDGIEGPAWYETFQLYHAGLISEFAKNTESAYTNLKAAYERDPNVLRTAEAWARFLLRNGYEEEGKEIADLLYSRFPQRPAISELNDHVQAGTKPPALLKNAMQGGMEVLYGLGSAIGREGGQEISYVYLNLAAHLAPDIPLPRLILGDLLEEDERYDRAIEHYDSISEDSIYRTNATMRTAFAYNAMDDLEKAREIMNGLLEEQPDNLIALNSYGNILRSHELFSDARELYSKAIALLKPEEERTNWSLFYSRGITNERINKWEEAEVDFRKALELRKDEPQVLNYLGYSLIDRDMKYEEALEMIRLAVQQRPNDAYIVDSLGWAYYKLERYDEAVLHLERAVELRPQDPILNDHLGDAYWKVGRKLEAVFQWSHARDLDPEPKDLKKIVQKLENGLEEDGDG